jgi:fused signal recognition particle receptor
MKFFRKLKEKLFSTSSKFNNGLEEIVDKQKDEIFNQDNNENEDSNNHISSNMKEDLGEQKKEIETASIKDEKRNKVTEKQPSFFEKNKKTNIELDEKQIETQDKKSSFFKKIIKSVEKVTKRRKLDDTMLTEIEDLLISSDLGVATSSFIVEKIKKENFSKELDITQLKQLISSEIYEIMNAPKTITEIKNDQLNIWLFVGVNGSGKTTTIGKIAKQEKENGNKVILAAADTFRAAAVEQLSIWSERAGIPMIKGEEKSDPASVVYKAIEESKRGKYDLLLIDTAGRLQNKTDLMEELEKIIRVIKKQDPTAPHNCIIVLDATSGQNVNSQVEIFSKTAGLTGIVMTKLDGTARGGVLVSVTNKFNLPIYRIGLGEKIDDLEIFDPKLFSKVIVGLDNDTI